MDTRKKTIRELELKKGETLGAIDGMLANLGETFLTRDSSLENEDGDIGNYRTEYRRILKEIGDSEEHIKTIETDLYRLKETDEEIRLKEQEYSKVHKELSELYTCLGELIMDDPEYAVVTESFKSQMDILVPKIKSLEDRLDEIAGDGQSNVFAWIGKNTQGMVLRSLLGKSKGSLQQIYTAVGEKFVVSQDRTGLHDQEIQKFLNKIDEVRRILVSLTGELDALKAERRKIDDFFIAEGNPVRKTHGLERHIAHVQEQLKLLYQNYGTKAEMGTLSIPLTENDIQALEKIKNLRENNDEYDKSIEKLKASLAIDALREEIERMEKGIISHRQRIAASEESIADFEKRIGETNRHIQELMKIGDYGSKDR